jgi:hypothetical protein
MFPTHIYFSMAYISLPRMIFVKSTWESMQLSSSDFKVRCFLWTVQITYLREAEYCRQFLGANVCVLQNHGYEPLQGVSWALDSEEKAFFESIRLNTASVKHWRNSLKRLSVFLARKFGRELWYSLTNMRRQIMVLMNLTFSPKCILHIPPDHG